MKMTKAEIIRRLKALRGDWDRRWELYSSLPEFAAHAVEEIDNILEQLTEEEIQAAITKE